MNAARADNLMQDMVLQALTDLNHLTDLYSVRYAARERQQHVQHA
jgi:hypothetical protein